MSTLPDWLIPARDRYVKEALHHPASTAFRFMTPVEVVQSIENRLWSLLHKKKAEGVKRVRFKYRHDPEGSQNLTEIRCERDMTGEELTDYLA